jgi:hypothetical protein
MQGTAPNYFAGQTTIGSTTLTLGSAGTVAQQFGVVSASATNIAAVIRGATSQTGDLLQIQNSAGTKAVFVEANGALGIGVTSVASGQALEVGLNGSTGVYPVRFTNLNTGSNTTKFAGILFGGYDTVGSPKPSGEIAVGPSDVNYVTSFMRFATRTSDVVTERMRIDSAGNVGIGTTTPAAKLDVNGSIKSDNLSSVNAVLNSSFNVWQRGVSVGGGGGIYSADRWYLIRSGFAAGATASRQPTGDTTNLPNIQYCIRVQRDSGNTSTASVGISQSFETINSIPFAGKTVTFSFYARKSSTFSGNIVGLVAAGTGTDQNVSLGYSGFNTPISITPGSGSAPSLTTTWQRYTLSGAIPTTATEIAIAIDMTV